MMHLQFTFWIYIQLSALDLISNLNIKPFSPSPLKFFPCLRHHWTEHGWQFQEGQGTSGRQEGLIKHQGSQVVPTFLEVTKELPPVWRAHQESTGKPDHHVCQDLRQARWCKRLQLCKRVCWQISWFSQGKGCTVGYYRKTKIRWTREKCNTGLTVDVLGEPIIWPYINNHEHFTD